MDNTTQTILSEVVAKAGPGNDLILVLVLLLVGLIVVFLPFYMLLLKDKKTVIDVVVCNTRAMTGLEAAICRMSEDLRRQ